MAPRYDSLNDQQWTVLRWIADGMPPDVMHGHAHKTSAGALQNRGLVRVTRRRGVWAASLTERGHVAIREGVLPARYIPSKHPTTASAGSVTRGASTGTVPKSPAATKPTEELLTELAAAGGELAIPSERRASVGALLSSVRRFNKVPEGKLLLLESTSWLAQDQVLRLVDVAQKAGTPQQQIPTPGQLRKTSPIVAGLRNSPAAFDLDGKVRLRALRLLQGLITALTDRGAVCRPGPERSEARQQRVDWAHLQVSISGHAVGLRVEQVIDRTRHVPTAAEQRSLETRPWTYLPRYDEARTDRLRLRLTGYGEYQRSLWVDSEKAALEDRLGEIVFELFARSVIAKRIAEQRAAAEKLRADRYERALQQARVELREAHRADVLNGQVQAWRRAGELRSYAEALASRINELSAAERAEATAWHTWIADYIGRVDPLRQALRVPEEAGFTDIELRQHVARTTGLRPY